jgi:hypothetical protein
MLMDSHTLTGMHTRTHVTQSSIFLAGVRKSTWLTNDGNGWYVATRTYRQSRETVQPTTISRAYFAWDRKPRWFATSPTSYFTCYFTFQSVFCTACLYMGNQCMHISLFLSSSLFLPSPFSHTTPQTQSQECHRCGYSSFHVSYLSTITS